MVPIVSALKAGNLQAVSKTTWMACLIALVGIVIMNVDPSIMEPHDDDAVSVSILSTFSGGEGLILASAFLYSIQVVRIGDFAKKINPVELSAVKAVVEATASWAIVAALVLMSTESSSVDAVEAVDRSNAAMTFAISNGNDIRHFWETCQTRSAQGTLPPNMVPQLAGTIIWAGTVCTAGLVAFQSYAQRFVNPSDANLVYSLQPVFTASFAYWLLGEQMNTAGFVGGAVVLSAVLLAATKNRSSSEETSIPS
mmetsp:Transcript_16747/g.34541  ORF Transcript_16747/g.34541 Transcript_16747/m.34541 type:complete len:254 (+) Transcript_16747:505-1266(+)